MSTLDELIESGHTKARLPFWNPHAYLSIREGAVWCDLFDLLSGIGGGEPIPMLVSEAAGEWSTWEPKADGSA